MAAGPRARLAATGHARAERCGRHAVAKKIDEDGQYGGKGTCAHEATVIGDTAGDLFKDTAGPAINPVIKVMIRQPPPRRPCTPDRLPLRGDGYNISGDESPPEPPLWLMASTG